MGAAGWRGLDPAVRRRPPVGRPAPVDARGSRGRREQKGRERGPQLARLGACPSIRRILLAKDERVGFHLAA